MANTKKKNKLSLIVPCFNEEEALPFFYNETVKVLSELKEDYEIILVNDGSGDNTLKVMKDLSKKDKHIVYLSFSRNFGKESAMYAGICNASGDYIGLIDADLQHPPVLIKDMITALESGKYDCAACRRVDRKGDSKIRTWFARKFYKLINIISDARMIDGAGDFRIMTREMAEAVISMSEYNRFSKGIFSWVGFNTYWIEYENVERVAGTTSWSFWGLVKYAIDGIVNFSNAPLDLASFFGLATTMLAFVYLLFIVIKYILYGDPVAGWPTLVCVILVMGGMQLFALGIIGQYVGKTYMEVKNRPHYIISESNKRNLTKIK
ncbi:MAG: glycosyltransferase family 2 protein [Erysipelotrichaceae bacterium]|nr:glycosyltransferase family 2 protein [Erysipelotrichaceae bacterium]